MLREQIADALKMFSKHFVNIFRRLYKLLENFSGDTSENDSKINYMQYEKHFEGTKKLANYQH